MLKGSNFFKRFTKKAENDKNVRVALFGKHPVFDDHMEIIGERSELVTRFRDLVYSEGIGKVIDKGLWSEIDNASLIPFSHYYVWKLGRDVLFGKLWASSDGKGRRDYPMLICVQSSYELFSEESEFNMDLFDEVQDEIQAAGAFAELEDIVKATEEKFCSIFNDIEKSPKNKDVKFEGLKDVLFDEGVVSEKLKRVCYQLLKDHVHLSNFQNEKISDKDVWEVRVPDNLMFEAFEGFENYSVKRGLVIWLSFIEKFFSSALDKFIFMPSEKNYFDLIVGKPEARNLYCLKAGLAQMPLTTEIPYKTEEFENNFKVRFV
ncbi:hypothetical protein [Sedimentisphaera salicampi]|uniref:Uncharacterized protein n=1 Tax=Sedimentisphaera salicampi TaxID=1941349 RepID=A0A1W6LMG0_9BACT|nr:hypothetical protein [Sedimentisphaera salicampi]ARN56923.1 hypothetical protein STSP1_01316 [Sedimentisphaera salicampi]